MTFSDKIKRAREVAKMTQHELAQEVGVSQRTIASYESGGARARKSTTEKLAHALKVSVRYLSDDDCTNPLEDIEKDEYLEQARELYGAKGVRDMDELLRDNAALFAGGELSQDQKDAFFQAVMTAYVSCLWYSSEFIILTKGFLYPFPDTRGCGNVIRRCVRGS